VSHLDYKPFYRRNLPHIQPPGAGLFVTFRLAGSLPRCVIEALLAAQDVLEQQLAAIPEGSERDQLAYREQRRLFGRWDTALDTNLEGPHWLRDPRAADQVAQSLHFLDGKQYDLDCYSILSNHVHVILTPLPTEADCYHALQDIMHSLKGYTANHINPVLGRTGQFWQHENYDHYIRDPDEWLRIRWYVLNNPVKAGLAATWRDWPWTYCKEPNM
jgi:REP element-mobilizing transposase RayT